MKFDRRSFLSLAIGGAAGTALSPLPWKLVDDSSIWSQNWPWTPVPEDGKVSYVNSTCSLCPGGCGITVRKVEDRVVKIEGMKDHPVNDGGICLLGLSGPQLLYSPTRVRTPMKRIGTRGEGRWQRISWEQAIDEVAETLGNVRTAGNAHTVGCIAGPERGTVAHLMERFLMAYGSANFVRTPTMADLYEHTLYLTHGIQASAGFDVENTDLLLSFGSGVIDGWGSPVRMFRAKSRLKEAGAKVIQVEPRLSNSAAKADQWIPINPGTEADLALGIANVIVSQGLYDKAFVERHAAGFEEFSRQLQSHYALNSVATTTGIDGERIKELAQAFAGAAKPLAICGRGQGRTPGNLKEFLAVHTLNALTGSVNREGGVFQIPDDGYIPWSDPELDEAAAQGLRRGRLDRAGSDEYPASRHLLNRFAGGAVSEEPYGMQVLFVANANPLYAMPGAQEVRSAFAKIPYIVSFSSYMDETAMNADLILPNHVYLERFEDVRVHSGLARPTIGLSRPVVAPQFNTRHLGDTIIRLAKAMGGTVAEAFPWKDYQACLEGTLGDKWKTLAEETVWTDTAFQPPPPEEAFKTYSMKFDFAGRQIDRTLKSGAVEPEGESGAYPLMLIPYDTLRLAGHYIGDPPFVMKTVPDTVLKGKDSLVEINPETAGNAGLAEGQYALLNTPRGQARVKVHLYEGIKPGVVAMPRGLGHTAYDEFLAGKGVNINELMGPVEDPASGHDAAWGIRAQLTKA